jgi:hypothetical protein
MPNLTKNVTGEINMTIRKILIDTKIILVSNSKKQIEKCFNYYANVCDGDYEVECVSATPEELDYFKWVHANSNV